jgi:hypothetical protein
MERERTATECMTERGSDRETERARKELKKVKKNREMKENWTDKQ